LPAGATPVTFHELRSTPESSAAFHKAISAAKASSKFGASVHVYDRDDYGGMRLFLDEDAGVGFALKGDDIVSAFKHDKSPVKGAVSSMLGLATSQGGRRLDAFDTVLPDLYGREGFRAVARVKFNPDYKPDDWSYDTFAKWLHFRDFIKFNGGKPDVVFMVHDPGYGQPYKAGDGAMIDDYDEGAKRQAAALRRRKH